MKKVFVYFKQTTGGEVAGGIFWCVPGCASDAGRMAGGPREQSCGEVWGGAAFGGCAAARLCQNVLCVKPIHKKKMECHFGLPAAL